MKHLLVVDVKTTTENKHICKDDESKCPLWNEEISFCMYNFNNNTKGCPLKPMPERFEPTILTDYCLGNSDGWNACIDEILGEEE